MIFKMVFEDGFFMVTYPGNLLVLEDGRIGLGDFGLVGRMSRHMKDGMAELLFALSYRMSSVSRGLCILSATRGGG